MSGMAEVLAAHGEWRYTNGAGTEIVCKECGAPIGNLIDHQAAALTAAGFGPVKEAAAVALEEAAAAVEPSWFQYHGGRKDMNESRRAWLRARAAAVRGEG